MPDWLKDVMTDPPTPAGTMAVRLVLAAVFGAAVALVYRMSHGGKSRDAWTLTVTLVLLCILLAMVSMVIGESIARAFGLVGALSIVRFRTVVEDTRDTAFVIFAVIVGMAVGTGLVLVPLIGIPVVAAAALALHRSAPETAAAKAGPSLLLTVRLGLGRNPDEVVGGVLVTSTISRRLVGIATARQGSALDITYAVELGAGVNPATVVHELNGLDGVQSVELREADLDD